MPKQRITTAINNVLNEKFGFEIYIVMKDGEQLVKRFVLDEGNPNETDDFKRRFRESITEAIYLCQNCRNSLKMYNDRAVRLLRKEC